MQVVNVAEPVTVIAMAPAAYKDEVTNP